MKTFTTPFLALALAFGLTATTHALPLADRRGIDFSRGGGSQPLVLRVEDCGLNCPEPFPKAIKPSNAAARDMGWSGVGGTEIWVDAAKPTPAAA
ncbi:hypothetical protein OC845_006782 [Tilletia horrida]|nr:hypothetical protein OC845_006782 [Tilletia horrida]